MPHFANGVALIPDGLVKDTDTNVNGIPYTSNASDSYSLDATGTYTAEREGFLRVTFNGVFWADTNFEGNDYSIDFRVASTVPSGVQITTSFGSGLDAGTIENLGTAPYNRVVVIYVKAGTTVSVFVDITVSSRMGNFSGDGLLRFNTTFEYDR